jgi:hypothetical protein
VVMGDFNVPLSTIDRSSKPKNQQRNPKNKWHHRSNGPNWCLQNISSTTAQYAFFLAVQGKSPK